MAGKLINSTQQRQVASLLTGLVAALDAKGFDWKKGHRKDIEIAYRSIGMPMPFSFSNVPKKPSLIEKLCAFAKGRE